MYSRFRRWGYRLFLSIFIPAIVVKLKNFKIKFVKVHKSSKRPVNPGLHQKKTSRCWHRYARSFQCCQRDVGYNEPLQCSDQCIAVIVLLDVVTLYVVVISSHKATFFTLFNFMNFILFQLKFIKFKSKIKFIKFELHNYDSGCCRKSEKIASLIAASSVNCSNKWQTFFRVLYLKMLLQIFIHYGKTFKNMIGTKITLHHST